jgi:hypothetical protein
MIALLPTQLADGNLLRSHIRLKDESLQGLLGATSAAVRARLGCHAAQPSALAHARAVARLHRAFMFAVHARCGW